jgi:hypothetical protein
MHADIFRRSAFVWYYTLYRAHAGDYSTFINDTTEETNG